MDNKWFFEKFELIAELPDAVPRMRELVLELAFSGRFSAGDRINEIPNEWKSDRSPRLPDIPSTWLWLQGKDVFNVIRGVSYKKDQASEVRVDGYVPLLRANNIGLKVNFDELVYVPRNIVREEQMVQRGDILIAMSSGSKKLVGKAASIQNNIEYTFGAFCGIIRNKSDISNDILAWYFKSPQYTSWVTAAGRGIGINNLTKGDLESLPIPLPPLSEQHRIVSKVEELMGICDALEAQQQEREERKVRLVTGSLKRFSDTPSVENLGYLFHGSYSVSPSDLRKTILTLAVQGKLVPQDPAEGNSLVGTHFTFLNGYAFKSEWFKSEGTRLCRNANIRHGTLDWKDVAFVDEKITNEFSRFSLSENDIVLSLDRPIINTGLKVARVRNQDTPCLLLQRVAKPVPKHDQIDLDYFFLWLNSPMFIDAIDPGRSNGVPHISTRQIEQIQICAPPLETQRRIVVKVEKLIAMVDEAEVLETQASNQGSSLLDAIVHEIVATAE